ncbi:putative agmatinase 1 [Venturia nashicola]|uniref:Putative agmatinase 1 n=1 Tax=Venturia nashicola TaxID=86259 RepID=A0A4Z1PNV0_9PEZI|nr:putative agmatinase 1 [Venturia nashicola]TLD36596.1 putative agmatinase 1 [Venturia nashicola]
MYITITTAKTGKTGQSTINGLDSLTFFLKMQFAQTFIYWTCLWSVKASLLAFFKRLTTNLKGHVIAWWVIIAITALGYIVSVVSYPVSCASFDPLGCTSQRNATLALVSLRLSTAADILTDVLIIGLPMSLAMRARLTRRSRLAIIGVFFLGMFVVLFSVVRILVTNTNNTRPEPSWLALWSVVECSVACIVCNLAPFKVLFKGRLRTYNSDPYTGKSRRYFKDGKGVDSLELSGSSRSAQWSHPSHPAFHTPTHPWKRPEDESSDRGSFQQARRNPRRGLQTSVSSDRTQGDDFGKVQNGAIVVTREVNRKEILADQVTLPGEKSEDGMRTVWTDRESADSLD